jgi:ferrochelatase
LFNLGGPDSQEAVRPFLFNLFNDKAIIAAPQPVRFFIAQLISRGRENTAKANYALMGGGSPILPETKKQADALEETLNARGGAEFKCFIAMRYCRPFASDASKAAKDWGAERAILLPLYPQFSTTTTASSLKDWKKHSALPASAICCHPTQAKLAAAHADAIQKVWRENGSPQNPRVLFSAHGLPEKVIEAGDPYQWQVEQSATAIRALLPVEWETRISYQSRVGPLKWIGPSTEEEIEAAAKDKTGLIICPIAFVSEHVETLVELDIEYAHKAKVLGLPFYLRAATPGAAPGFIDALADLTELALAKKQQGPWSECGKRLCPAEFGTCPHIKSA